MIARALFRLHTAHLHAPGRPTSNSFISPTYAHFTRNSFVSPTYAKTGGCIPLKMSARRHFFSFSSQISAFGFLSSQLLARSFIFRITSIHNLSNIFRTLCPKTRGTPLGPSNPSSAPPRLLARLPAAASAKAGPFTAHSQSCYRTFTHPCLSLVTMEAGPGSHTNTMSIAISPRTVHFYQCALPSEIPS